MILFVYLWKFFGEQGQLAFRVVISMCFVYLLVVEATIHYIHIPDWCDIHQWDICSVFHPHVMFLLNILHPDGRQFIGRG